jgi:hypothetical protein
MHMKASEAFRTADVNIIIRALRILSKSERPATVLLDTVIVLHEMGRDDLLDELNNRLIQGS